MPPDGHDVGVDDADRAPLDQVAEAVTKVDVLAGADRCRDRLRQPHVLVGELPRDHVFVPGERELVERAPKPDARFEPEMTEMVRGERQCVADDVADAADVLDERIDADRRELDPGERVHDVGAPEGVGRRVHGALDAGHEIDADVHLEEPVPLVDTVLG